MAKRDVTPEIEILENQIQNIGITPCPIVKSCWSTSITCTARCLHARRSPAPARSTASCCSRCDCRDRWRSLDASLRSSRGCRSTPEWEKTKWQNEQKKYISDTSLTIPLSRFLISATCGVNKNFYLLSLDEIRSHWLVGEKSYLVNPISRRDMYKIEVFIYTTRGMTIEFSSSGNCWILVLTM